MTTSSPSSDLEFVEYKSIPKTLSKNKNKNQIGYLSKEFFDKNLEFHNTDFVVHRSSDRDYILPVSVKLIEAFKAEGFENKNGDRLAFTLGDKTILTFNYEGIDIPKNVIKEIALSSSSSIEELVISSIGDALKAKTIANADRLERSLNSNIDSINFIVDKIEKYNIFSESELKEFIVKDKDFKGLYIPLKNKVDELFNKEKSEIEKLLTNDRFKIMPSNKMSGAMSDFSNLEDTCLKAKSIILSLNDIKDIRKTDGYEIFSSKLNDLSLLVEREKNLVDMRINFSRDRSASMVKIEIDMVLPDTLVNHDKFIDFGKFTLIISLTRQFGSNEISVSERVIGAGGNISIGGYLHPHVASNGTVCYGNMEQAAQLARASVDLLSLTMNILLVMQHYNAASPYKAINLYQDAYDKILKKKEDEKIVV